ncbi:MAG TPA: SUMF1/EgtB/PvdO family nonheme iron enzyme [Labilithrix sp.]|nr:SUMF1/EgtB/PvdO family nonheme iron enzyme [Labilithrix sp.]
MKRSVIGSLLFVGGALVVVLAPAGESSAQDLDGPTRGPVTATDVAPPPAPLAIPFAVPAPAVPRAIVAASAGLKGLETPDLGLSANCGENQVEVDGDYCPALEQKCLRWMDPETTVPRRCSEFAPTGKCQGKTVKKHFCIDKYEYPNKLGEKPVVMKTWYEAADACKAQGKRLCGDSEWTLACEGQERLPYPYGYERNSQACNIDKPHPDVNETAMADPRTRDAEVARLWQGENSGSRESCVSPFGAMDMTGNVDEWVINESGMPYKSGLKGGYWGPVRDRCRPMTTAHYEQFVFYQIGFRCCADAGGQAAGVKPAQPGVGAPGGKLPGANPAPVGIAGS